MFKGSKLSLILSMGMRMAQKVKMLEMAIYCKGHIIFNQLNMLIETVQQEMFQLDLMERCFLNLLTIAQPGSMMLQQVQITEQLKGRQSSSLPRIVQ